MKKVILAISIFSALLACKKKTSDNDIPAPIVIPETPNGNGSGNGNCMAKAIKETLADGSITNTTITYNGSIPATIKVDSSGTEKINLILDEKGSIKSGKIPISFNGINATVDFVSTNTYNTSGLLIKAVKQSQNAPLGATALITSEYSYDANANLTLRIETTKIDVPFPFTFNKHTRDSLVFTSYSNGRPGGAVENSRDLSAGMPYTETYSEVYDYDANMNRTKITRYGTVTEETTFSSEIYPAKVGYLVNLKGNPNYGNKDQDVNFMQRTKTTKKCTPTNVFDISVVKTFEKSGSCISKVILADTTTACGGSPVPSSSTYQISY